MVHLSGVRIGRRTRIFLFAAALALTATSLPAFQAEALAKPKCVPAGCGKAKCKHNGKEYVGGETITVTNADGKKDVYHCDGNTGKWVKWRIQTEGGPVIDLPTTAEQP